MLPNSTSPPHSPLEGISLGCNHLKIPTKNRHGEMLGKMYAFGVRGKHQKQPLEKQEQDPEREKGDDGWLQHSAVLTMNKHIGYGWKLMTPLRGQLRYISFIFQTGKPRLREAHDTDLVQSRARTRARARMTPS